MEHLIDKDALVAEIERMMAEEMALFEESLKDDSHEISAAPVVYTRLQMLLSVIDTLEVKEVDLQEEPQVKESTKTQHVNDVCKEKGDSLTQESVINVWHGMSEEAENGRNIIVIDPKDFYGAVLRKGGSQLKNHNKERYVKWAYIDDIINITNKEEPVSEELEEAAIEICSEILKGETIIIDGYEYVVLSDAEECFKAGAKWQQEKEYTCYEEAFEDGAKWKVENLWKPADGDDLPEYEREVVVFTQNYPDDAGMMMVAIGHRPTPDGYDGKSLTTGEVEHYIPETYGKGGWNIPNVKYWLDAKLPYEESKTDNN